MMQKEDDNLRPSERNLNMKTMDLVSHFILRLAFCRTPELRSWFIAQETELFKVRIRLTVKDQLSQFLTDYSIPVKTERADLLRKRTDLPEWFKDGLDDFELMRQDKLDTSYTLSNLIIYSTMARHFDRLQGDTRVLKLLHGLTKLTGANTGYTKAAPGEVCVENIDTLCTQSFPPCMRLMHEHLRKEHHHKHSGRMQYGLFLKGIGLSLEDSMRLWKTEFTKKMDADKFDRHYAYNIRHNYGKEGKRTDYTPHSCTKIIAAIGSGPDDCQGCPFKGANMEALEKKLKEWSVGVAGITKILEKAKDGNCQSACTRYFESMHGLLDLSADTIGHPNQYFTESRIIKEKEGKSEKIGEQKMETEKSQ